MTRRLSGKPPQERSAAAAEIVAVLERHGARVTAPRRAVLEAAIGLQRPFTSEQLVEACPAVGRATVYRTLELLQALGTVSRIAGAEGRVRYVLDAPGHWHHLICVSCGETVPFSSCPIPGLVSELSRSTRFHIEGHSLEVFGRCPSCQRDAGRAETA